MRLLLRCSVNQRHSYVYQLTFVTTQKRSDINRVNLYLQPKSVLKNRRNFDGILIDDEVPSYESGEDSPRLHLTEQQLDNDVSVP